MIGNEDDIEIIAHYTSLDKCFNLILKQKQILLNNIYKSNDPFENHKYHFKLPHKYLTENNNNTEIEWPQIIYDNFKKSLNSEISDILKENIKISCFCNTENNEPYNLPRMWEQYGDSHSGACLLFKKDKIIQKMKNKYRDFCRCDKIKYSLNTIEQYLTIQKNHIKDNKIISNEYKKYIRLNKYEIFYLKNKDWQSESEFRILVEDNKCEETYIDISDCLFGIIVGYKVSNESTIPISIIAKKYNIPIFKAKWKNGVLSEISKIDQTIYIKLFIEQIDEIITILSVKYNIVNSYSYTTFNDFIDNLKHQSNNEIFDILLNLYISFDESYIEIRESKNKQDNKLVEFL